MTNLLLDMVFLVFAGMTMACAGLVLFLKNLLHSALALFFCLLGLAALYVLLGADFLGVVQVLIYAGGILVLLLFGIFVTTRIHKTNLEFSQRRWRWYMGITVSMSVFFVMVLLILFTPWSILTHVHYVSTTPQLGHLLLRNYVLPFEVISILLLYAAIGSIWIVRKELEVKS